MAKRRAHSGFTLVELMLVLVVLSVLAGLALPALFGQLGKAKLDSSADQLVGLLQLARLEAMQRGTAVRVNYDPEKRRFFLDAQPSASQANQTGGFGSTNTDQETSDDGYIRITPMWAVGQTLNDDVNLKTTLVNPPSLRLLLQELLQKDSSQSTLGGQSTIDNSFTLTTSFDQPPDLPKAQGNFIPIEFDADGTPRDRISLRVVLTERKADQVDGPMSSSTTGNDQLDPEETQRWICIEGLTGRVYAATPSKEIVELANQHQGQSQSSSATKSETLQQGGTP